MALPFPETFGERLQEGLPCGGWLAFKKRRSYAASPSLGPGGDSSLLWEDGLLSNSCLIPAIGLLARKRQELVAEISGFLQSHRGWRGASK